MAIPVMKVVVLFCGSAFFAATAAIGLAFLRSPSIQSGPNPWLHVASLDAIPDDGIPHDLRLFAKERDVWTKLPDRPIGHIFVRRLPSTDRVVAIHSITSFGSRMEFDKNANEFREPCWGMRYDINGKCLNEEPNAGDLDLLQTKTEEGSVFVIFGTKPIRGNP